MGMPAVEMHARKLCEWHRELRGSRQCHANRATMRPRIPAERTDERTAKELEGDERRYGVARKAEPACAEHGPEAKRRAGPHSHFPQRQRASELGDDAARVVEVAHGHAATGEHEVTSFSATQVFCERIGRIWCDAKVHGLSSGGAHRGCQRVTVRRDDAISSHDRIEVRHGNQLISRGEHRDTRTPMAWNGPATDAG